MHLGSGGRPLKLRPERRVPCKCYAAGSRGRSGIQPGAKLNRVCQTTTRMQIFRIGRACAVFASARTLRQCRFGSCQETEAELQKRCDFCSHEL